MPRIHKKLANYEWEKELNSLDSIIGNVLLFDGGTRRAKTDNCTPRKGRRLLEEMMYWKIMGTSFPYKGAARTKLCYEGDSMRVMFSNIWHQSPLSNVYYEKNRCCEGKCLEMFLLKGTPESWGTKKDLHWKIMFFINTRKCFETLWLVLLPRQYSIRIIVVSWIKYVFEANYQLA